MNKYEEIEMARRVNNLHSLSQLSEVLCKTLELAIDPAVMAVDMEKTLEENLKKHGIIKGYDE
jgi:acyl-ACP thioesterase